jgi:trehalose-phosphatase
MQLPVTIDPRCHHAVIFDLDGVVTDTASVHAAAWARLFDDFLARRPADEGEDHSIFTDDDYRRLVDGKSRYDGVAGFLASRGISLERGLPSDGGDYTVCGLGNRKQQLLLDLLADGVPLFEATVDLVRELQDTGVATAVYSSGRNCQQVLKAAGVDDLFPVRVDGVVADELGLAGMPDPAVFLEAARRLGVPPDRAVVVDDADAGVTAGRNGGFALVIGVDRTGHADELLQCGADVVVTDLADVTVRTGDKRMSEIPNAVESFGQLVGVLGARESAVFLDYDGTLSPIASDPGAAKLVDGAAEALEHLAALGPVAVLSGRALADIQSRVGIPGIWYAGSHGFELIGPDGSYHQNDAAITAVPVLKRAAGELRGRLAQIPGVRVDHKRFAVAVHYREVAPERVAEIVAATHRLGQRDGLRVTTGRRVVELRPDIDWDKGTTLAWIRDRIDPS